MLTVTEVSERLKISRSKAYGLIDSGKLAHYKIDCSVRVSEEQLQEYLNACRRPLRQDSANPLKRVRLKHLR